MAKNDTTGKKDWKEVSQTFINHHKEVYVVTFESGGVEVDSLGTTSEHPFWVEGVGWLPASDLKAGDQVVTATGIDLVVKRVIATGTFKTTYNFEVKDYHTYFVGEAGVWVHNSCENVESINDAKYAQSRLNHNTQVGEVHRKRKSQIHGAHNEESFKESIEMLGGEIIGPGTTNSQYPGLTEYSYKLPVKDSSGNVVQGEFKKVEKKTVYSAPLNDGLFLAVLMDLYSRRIVGWAIDKRMTTSLICEAINRAVALRQPPKGLVFHNDRGSQYTSNRFGEYWKVIAFEPQQVMLAPAGIMPLLNDFLAA